GNAYFRLRSNRSLCEFTLVLELDRQENPMKTTKMALAPLVFGIAATFGGARMPAEDKTAKAVDPEGITAIDILLVPDTTLVQHAEATNARLLKVFPKGFALDASHHPHITMLQQFVRTDDLDKAYAAVNKVLAGEKPTSWNLKAFKYYYIPSPPVGLAGIVVEPTEDLLRLQQKII